MTRLPRLLACVGLIVLWSSALCISSAHAQAPKAFIRDDLQTSGAQLEERLKREIALPSTVDARQLTIQSTTQLARNEPRRALALANQAVVADGRNAEGWRLMSRAAQAIEPRDYRKRYELAERALTSAYVAYQRSGSKADEGASLRLLGKIF